MSTTQPTLLRQSRTSLRMLVCLAALGWATPKATAGLIIPDAMYVQQTNPSANGSATAQAKGKPFPSVTADATDSTPGPIPGSFNNDPGSYSAAEVVYYFGVAGQPGVKIPLDISSNVVLGIDGEVTSSAWSVVAEAIILLAPPQGGEVPGIDPVFNDVESFSGDPNNNEIAAQKKKDLELDVLSGTVYEITIEAGAYARQSDSPQVLEVHAIVDPVISFAPGFDSTGYSLQFSPGIGNSFGSAVPEPSTLVLSSIAFGTYGIVCAYRRRKRTRAAA